MATSGTWSNVGDWLLHCMLHARHERILVSCTSVERGAFVTQIVTAIARFASYPRETRSNRGIDALETQSSIRAELAKKNCLFLADTGASMIRFYSADRVKRDYIPAGNLIVGIALMTSNRIDLGVFNRHCKFEGSARACPLPALPPGPVAAPPVEPVDQISISDDDAILPVAVDDDVIMSEADAVDEKAGKDDGVDDNTTFFTKCPVCLEVPFPPWQTTTCGHLICPECHAKLPKRTTCPTCRQTCADTLVPQLLLTEVAKAQHVKLACRHDGCTAKLDWDKAQAHHNACLFRPLRCIMQQVDTKSPACAWRGSADTLGEHLVHAHGVTLALTEPTAAAVSFLEPIGFVYWKAEQLLVRKSFDKASGSIRLAFYLLRHRGGPGHFLVDFDCVAATGSCTLKVLPFKMNCIIFGSHLVEPQASLVVTRVPEPVRPLAPTPPQKRKREEEEEEGKPKEEEPAAKKMALNETLF